LNKSKEGTFGLKTHLPFGTVFNFYNFISFYNIQNIDSLALSIKFEMLLLGNELSLSAWVKKHYLPVYAFDLSSKFLGVDFKCEGSFSYGDNKGKIKEEIIILGPSKITNYSIYKEKEKWLSQVSIGFNKSFEFMDVSDRVNVNLEFFYNQNGYKEYIFDDKFKTMFLIQNNLFIQNYLGVYYASLFISVKKFLLTDMVFNINSINNLSDKSMIISLSFNYNPVINYYLNLNIYSFIGKDNSEYTFSGNKLGVDFSLIVNF